MISIKNLTKEFSGQKVLDGIDIDIEKGEVVALVGASGAGKSTVLNILGGMDTNDEGRVIIDGKDISEYTAKELTSYRREDVGFVFQFYNLVSNLTARENVELASEIVPNAKDATQTLVEVGLGDRLDNFPSQLSGGEQQRVAIARAVAKNPKILLCDEATSALDPQTTSSILALLKDINERFNITIVIITHQMSVVREICSHVAIVKGGEVAEQGTVEEIFTHPKTAVARELLKNDVGDGEEKNRKTTSGKELIQSGEKIRIVFSENSAFEPVIANLILNFNEPVNILKADTKNVRGVAKGEMILEFAPDCTKNKEMKQYLLDRGLDLEEVNENVD